MSANNKQFLGWQKEIIRYFWPFIAHEKPYLIFLGLISLVTIAANTLLIWMIGKTVTQITQGNFEHLNQTLLFVAGIVLFNMIIQFVYTYNYQRASLRFVDRVRGHMFSHIMRLSYPVFFKFQKGDLITRLGGDVDRLLRFIFNLPLNLAGSIVVLSVYSTMVFWINWQLALLAVLMAPLFFLSQFFVGPKTGELSKKFTQEKAKLVSLEEQSLSNLRGISAFNSESIIREKHRNQFVTARTWALKLRMLRMGFNAIFTILMYFVSVVIIYAGVSSIQSGSLEVGQFVSFLIYIRFLTNPIRSFARIPIQLQNNRIAADRITEILEMKPESEGFETTRPLSVSEGKIVFSDVGFSYPGTDTPIFENLNVVINPGQTVALVGASGAGKSTFAGLLLRFFNPQQGTINVDGNDIKSVSLTSLREQMSIVWQEPLIVNGTIKENLLLAKPDATQEQMISACKHAHAWEFIEKLDNNLDTLLGANGITLSAGQQQRLSIAQAFLRDTPILILDEASSALDSHSEQMIVEAINSLRKNRTTLIIAHRFSSIRNADCVLYFNGNRNITAGTHEELIQQEADYKSAVEWQISQNAQ